MSNLLPKEMLEDTRRRFYHRLLLAGALAFLFAAVFLGLALLPAYIAPKIEQGLLKEGSVASAPEMDSESRAERESIARAQAMLARVSAVISATSSATELLAQALRPRPEGVTVNRLNFTLGDDGAITIEGNALSREEINLYRQELGKSEKFTGVSVPVGSLLGAEGGRFTITLKGAF